MHRVLVEVIAQRGQRRSIVRTQVQSRQRQLVKTVILISSEISLGGKILYEN
jgi:hypothetical protein